MTSSFSGLALNVYTDIQQTGKQNVFFCSLLRQSDTGPSSSWQPNQLRKQIHILHSVHYNSFITIQANKCTTFFIKITKKYYGTPTTTYFGPYWPIIREHTFV